MHQRIDDIGADRRVSDAAEENLLKTKMGGSRSPDFDVIDNPIVVTFASLGF